MTRVYIGCPSTDYRSVDLMRAIAAAKLKWPDAEVFVPDSAKKIFLADRQGIEHFVFLSWYDGRITFGVGRELKLASQRQIGLWQYNRTTGLLDEVQKVPRGILNREDTAELERAHIQETYRR